MILEPLKHSNIVNLVGCISEEKMVALVSLIAMDVKIRPRFCCYPCVNVSLTGHDAMVLPGDGVRGSRESRAMDGCRKT